MQQYELIYKKINALVPGLDSMAPGDAVTLKSSGFMDLHVDVLDKQKDKTIISMAHYYKMNGDCVPDPDMEVAVYPHMKMAEALSYQDSYGYQSVYPEEGKVDVKAKSSLNQFLNMWLNNLKSQGHKPENHRGGGANLGK